VGDIDCAGIRWVLLDIEGTTTRVEFVTEVLFPYARAGTREHLLRHAGDPALEAIVAALREEHVRDEEAGAAALPPWDHTTDAVTAYVHFLMDQDRKSTPLKALQGRIWEGGYRSGALRGEVYADVPPALERWRRQGRQAAIYSSGSVRAQELLFSTTAAGDLTPSLAAHFDTTTGPKREPESYGRIARSLGAPPAEVLFLSDVAAELEAARQAGMRTALCVRGEEAVGAAPHPLIHTFDAVCPDPA
jgi:enolase-phosphatase E1